MTTARRQLDELGFDWENGIVAMRRQGYWDDDQNKYIEPGTEIVGPDHPEMIREFYPGHGSVEGPSILAYDSDGVYVSICYDGAEWITRVPRNPTEAELADFDVQHYGGG